MTNVAQTILNQLGGNEFRTMTAAKDFVYSEDSLQFKIGGNSKRILKVAITLAPSDTYSMAFFKKGNIIPTLVSEHSGVYCDQLQALFTAETGLDTSL